MYNNDGPGSWQQVFLDPDDPRFSKATPSPIMNLIGIPLGILPLDKSGGNNAWCTLLLMDPLTGFAPLQFQSIGNALLCRKDRMPITPEHVCQLGDFINLIVDQFGGDDDQNIHKKMATKEFFIQFLTQHVEGYYYNKLGVSW